MTTVLKSHNCIMIPVTLHHGMTCFPNSLRDRLGHSDRIFMNTLTENTRVPYETDSYISSACQY